MNALMKSAALGAAVVIGLGAMTSWASAAEVLPARFQNRLTAPFGDGTETYNGEADTYLNGGSTSVSDRNYGGATVMVGNNARGNLALIRFDLTSMKGKYDHLTSASLIVRATVNPDTLPPMTLYAVTADNGDWVPGTSSNTVPNDGSSTYNYMQYYGANDPRNVAWGSGAGLGVKINDDGTDTSDPAGWGFGPTPLGSVTILSSNRIQFQIPVSLIEQWIDGTNYGLVLTAAAVRDGDGNIISSPAYSQVPTFYASEQNSTASPLLVVSYAVPEPMTGSILLLSGGLLLLRRRRGAEIEA